MFSAIAASVTETAKLCVKSPKYQDRIMTPNMDKLYQQRGTVTAQVHRHLADVLLNITELQPERSVT